MDSGFKKGDPAPKRYIQWHEWAEVQEKAGLKQVECGICGKFNFPQELSKRTVKSELGVSPVCKKCE